MQRPCTRYVPAGRVQGSHSKNLKSTSADTQGEPGHALLSYVKVTRFSWATAATECGEEESCVPKRQGKLGPSSSHDYHLQLSEHPLGEVRTRPRTNRAIDVTS